MESDLIVGRTKEDIERKIEEKKAEGWEVFGEVTIAEPKLESNIPNLPQFIYYLQFMIKKDSNAK